MTDRERLLDELRPVAFALAYRMLGSVSEAEDVVQEALLRVHQALAAGEQIASPPAFVATVTTRLAINEFRSAPARRERYVGEWLPEPIITDTDGHDDPARHAETADSLSLAMLVLLESLSPEQRAREGGTQMSDRIGEVAMAQRGRIPQRVRFFSPILKFLLVAGVPMGPNGLITIRGRKSSLPRTTPLAIVEVGGKRWVWAPWGEVNWVRNLRAAGRATITKRRRREEVVATELDPTQRVEFFRDVLGPLARGIPLGVWFLRVVDGVDIDDPVEAAEGRRVFELKPIG
jgi:deazaflavin-dependent oxidoreductase (nitroreductase family)